MEQLQHRNTKLQQDNEQNSISLEQLSLQIQQQASDLKVPIHTLNEILRTSVVLIKVLL